LRESEIAPQLRIDSLALATLRPVATTKPRSRRGGRQRSFRSDVDPGGIRKSCDVCDETNRFAARSEAGLD